MQILKKALAATLAVIFLSTLFISCGGNKEKTEGQGEDSTDLSDSVGMMKISGKTQNIFYAIPSPIELAQLIQKAGAKYDKKILNSIDNVSKYSTTTSKALNLGVYGADLSYTSVFDDNTQESILYLSCTRKLAESLGVGSAFDEKTIDRIQGNTGQKDSLLTIISDSYMSTDEILKESQRENSSSLVIAGGFIEAIYLGTQLSKTTKNSADIITRLAEQKGTMDNVVGLLSTYEKDSGVAGTLADVKALKEIFDLVTIETKSATETKTNKKTNVTTIGGKIIYTMSPEALEKLTVKAAEIRNRIITGQI